MSAAYTKEVRDGFTVIVKAFAHRATADYAMFVPITATSVDDIKCIRYGYMQETYVEPRRFRQMPRDMRTIALRSLMVVK